MGPSCSSDGWPIPPIHDAHTFMKTVLFLCTGNYYRSRFAEIYFNWHAPKRGLAWQATSRGLGLDPCNQGPLSLHTLLRLRELGIPLTGGQRLPQPARLEDFQAADHIVAVKATEHRPMIQRRFPDWLKRVEFWEVHDLDCAGPEEAMPCLEQEVIALMTRLGEERLKDESESGDLVG
jgi:low molecular weight protein-tyrosine phosphatase